MASNTNHQGTVKDPQHDGRLKQNRQADETKSATPGSKARAEEHGKQSNESSHSVSGGSHAGGSSSRASDSRQPGKSSSSDDDLKFREYNDEKGDVHHHTKSYMEQHKGE